MALSELWASKVASDPLLLLSVIDPSVHDLVRPVQSKAVQVILREQDVFMSVPTGRIQQVACIPSITCMCIIYDGEVAETPVSVPLVLVVSPLLALMKDQAENILAYLEPSHYCYLRNLCQQILLVVDGPTFLQALKLC